MVKGVIGAHRHQHVAALHSNTFRCQVRGLSEIEFVELAVTFGFFLCNLFRYLEDHKEDHGKSHTGNSSHLFCKQVDEAQGKQSEGNERYTHRNFCVSELEIERHPKFPLARLLVAQHQHCQAFHGEAPHHAECISFAQNKNVASAKQDRE